MFIVSIYLAFLAGFGRESTKMLVIPRHTSEALGGVSSEIQ